MKARDGSDTGSRAAPVVSAIDHHAAARPAGTAETLLAADLATRSLDIRVESASAGESVLTMVVQDQMINGHGVVHGGYLFLLADTAFAYAAHAPEAPSVTRAAEIAFVSPARLAETLTAHAKHRTSYGRSSIYDVTIRGEDGTTRAEVRIHGHHARPGFGIASQNGTH